MLIFDCCFPASLTSCLLAARGFGGMRCVCAADKKTRATVGSRRTAYESLEHGMNQTPPISCWADLNCRIPLKRRMEGGKGKTRKR